MPKIMIEGGYCFTAGFAVSAKKYPSCLLLSFDSCILYLKTKVFSMKNVHFSLGVYQSSAWSDIDDNL